MKRFNTILFVIMLLAQTVYGQGIIGSWKGLLDVGAVKLNIVFHFQNEDNGSVTCKLDSPDQGVKGITANVIHISSDSVKVSIPLLGVSYGGHLSDDIIKGVFSQAGYDFTLDLKKGNYMSDRPQTPVSPYPYKTEEISFVNQEDNAVLAGTLTYPVGYDESAAKGSVPVVLMVTGSGLQNRDEEVFDHKPFLVIADYLARNGIASLRYDDRSFGKSTGNASTATTKTFMSDAKNGIDYLKSMDKFGKIGVLGHSEGGTIAFMLGAEKHADFIISMAGAAVRGDKILVEQNRIALMYAGMSASDVQAYCAALEKICEYKSNNGGLTDAGAFEKIIRDNASDISEEAKENLKKVMNMDNPWMDYFVSYDPASDIKRVTCPVFALNGSLDTQVVAAQNLPVIRKLLPAHKFNAIKEYPGLNHLFQHAVTGNLTEYNKISETMSEEVLKDIVGWIKSLE